MRARFYQPNDIGYLNVVYRNQSSKSTMITDDDLAEALCFEAGYAGM